MARPKPLRPGRRISVWLPPESDKVAKQIDNMSGFVQLALSQASAIMAFDIIQREKQLPNVKPPTQDEIERFNRDNPLDPLTAKRLGKTQNGTEPSTVTGNSALDN